MMALPKRVKVSPVLKKPVAVIVIADEPYRILVICLLSVTVSVILADPYLRAVICLSPVMVSVMVA